MRCRSFIWVAVVPVALAGVLAVSAATALGARSEPSELELIVEGTWEWDVYWGPFQEGTGTFKSRAPFCAEGTFVEDPYVVGAATWRLTCADGTGGLTVSIVDGSVTRWQIVDGSGSYAGLRGGGSLRSGEALGSPSYAPGSLVTWRGTFVGVVDWGAEPDQPEAEDTVTVRPTIPDTVAPAIAIASARATKLSRPADAYSIKVALALRDDVEGNTVAYTLRVTQTRAHRLIVLASKEGTTASGSVSTTLRVVPGARVRTVQLRLSASDPDGNEVSLARSLKLPR